MWIPSSAMYGSDTNGADAYYVNSPVGEYGILFAQTSDGSTPITLENFFG